MTHQVAICQPHYIPWIGYFEMIDRVDEFVFLDDVDLIQRDWKTRNRIRKQRSGSEMKWLSVPIVRECRRMTPISTARIGGDGSWRQRHLGAFEAVYAGAPFFGEAHSLLGLCLGDQAKTIGSFNVNGVVRICEYLGVETIMKRSSDTPTTGHKTQKLVEICKVHNASAYLANNGAASYLEPEQFENAGIEMTFQDYEHPVYPQTSGGQQLPFLPYLSIMDLIANLGQEALTVVRQGRPASFA